MADQLPPDGKFRVWLTFRCPCGGRAYAGEVVQSETDAHGTGQPAVIHKMPHCHYFHELEPTEYLRWANSHGAAPWN